MLKVDYIVWIVTQLCAFPKTSIVEAVQTTQHRVLHPALRILSMRLYQSWLRNLALGMITVTCTAIAEAKPPYSPQGFLDYINSNPWKGNLFQTIESDQSSQCYELKPRYGTWFGLTKGELWYSEADRKY